MRADQRDRVGNYLMAGVGNYVIAPLGNYLTLSRFRLGNYLIADTEPASHRSDADRLPGIGDRLQRNRSPWSWNPHTGDPSPSGCAAGLVARGLRWS